MPQEYLCPKCHQPVKPSVKFCGNCGQALEPITHSQSHRPIADSAPSQKQTHHQVSATAAAPMPPVSSVRDFKGVKPATILSLIYSSLYLLIATWLIISPDSFSRITESDGTAVELRVSGIFLAVIFTSIDALAITLLTTRKLKYGKVAIITITVLLAITTFLNALTLSPMTLFALVPLGFAVRAIVAIYSAHVKS